MRRLLLSSVVIVAASVMLSACYYSFHPAWLKSDVVKMSKAAGTWHVHRYGDADPHELPDAAWQFTKQPVRVERTSGKEEYVPGFKVDVIDGNGRTAGLEAVFFKLGKETYVESIVDRVPMNDLAQLHVVPMRQVARVEFSRGQLKFFPLDSSELEKLGVSGKDDDATAALNFRKTKEWRAILLKHGPALFNDKAMFVLKREPVK